MRPRKKDRHLPPCVYHHHGSYWLVRGGKWTRLGKDLPSALAAYGKAWTRPAGTMPALIEQAIEARRRNLSRNTLAQYQQVARRLSEIMAEFSPEQVTQRDIVQIRLALAHTPNMANRFLSVLRLTFAYALEQQLIDTNPAVGIGRMKERERDKLVTKDEYDRIYAKAAPRLQVVMDLCYLTAQRISDVLRIKYTDLTDEGIAFRQQKTGKRIVVRWTPELRAVVDRAKELHGNVRAFTLLHTRKGTAPAYTTIRDQWDAAVAAAKVSGVTLHDIRAMSATAADEAGMNATALLGHTSPAMTRRYLRSKKTAVVEGPSFSHVAKKAS